MSSNIPAARERIERLIADLRAGTRITPTEAADILEDEVLPKMTRDFKGRVSVQSNPVTASLRDSVLARRLAFPDEPIQTTAQHFGLNSGRVSEIIAGDYSDL
jgi:hypothetical protein